MYFNQKAVKEMNSHFSQLFGFCYACLLKFSKEFQTFIAACLIPMLFVCVGTVSQGVSQKSWILELVTDHFLKFFKFFFHD